MKTENDHINLKVAGQDGSVVQFKIKRHTPLSKLMKAYCERQVILSWETGTLLPVVSFNTETNCSLVSFVGIALSIINWVHNLINMLLRVLCLLQGLSIRQIRFRFDGQPINETDTPAQVGEPSCHVDLCVVKFSRYTAVR